MEHHRLYKRGRIWWTWVKIGTKWRCVSTGCRDRPAAEIQAAKLERQTADPSAEAKASATLGSTLQLYLTHKLKLVDAKKRSETSREFYKTKAGNWQRVLEFDPPGDTEGKEIDLPLSQLTPAHVDMYIEFRSKEPGARRDSTISNHTLRKELTTLRQALTLAKRAGTYDGDIDSLFPIDFSAEYEPRDRVLDRHEVTKFLRALLPNKELNRHDVTTDRAAYVAFIIATGARKSGADRALDADVGTNAIRLRETKTKKADRTVPILTSDQKQLMDFALRNARGKDGKLFLPWDSINRDFVNSCARAGIGRCSPNDLRRTLATWLRAAGVQKDVVATLLGHTTSAMVERVYARLRPSDLARLMANQLGLKPEAECRKDVEGSPDSAGLVGLSEHDLLLQALEIKRNAADPEEAE